MSFNQPKQKLFYQEKRKLSVVNKVGEEILPIEQFKNQNNLKLSCKNNSKMFHKFPYKNNPQVHGKVWLRNPLKSILIPAEGKLLTIYTKCKQSWLKINTILLNLFRRFVRQ